MCSDAHMFVLLFCSTLIIDPVCNATESKMFKCYRGFSQGKQWISVFNDIVL